VLHTQNSTSFVLRTQKKHAKKQAKKSQPKKLANKSRTKKRHKRRQERWGKSLFLNLSCCCLETSLKLVLLTFMKPFFNASLKMKYKRICSLMCAHAALQTLYKLILPERKEKKTSKTAFPKQRKTIRLKGKGKFLL